MIFMMNKQKTHASEFNKIIYGVYDEYLGQNFENKGKKKKKSKEEEEYQVHQCSLICQV